jgi:hypothetical protein
MIHRDLKALLACLLLLTSFQANSQDYGKQRRDISEKVIAARKTSDELRPRFTWTSRTEVIKGKEVLNILIEKNQVGPDGTMISKTLNEQGAKMPTAFLIKDIAEEEKANIEKYLFGLRDFLKTYALHDTTCLIHFLGIASFAKPDTVREFLFSGKNVVIEEDELRWWIDEILYTTSKTEVTTKFQGDVIHFTATFMTLRNGLNYMAYADVLIPARNMTLQIQNYDYIPQ